MDFHAALLVISEPKKLVPSWSESLFMKTLSQLSLIPRLLWVWHMFRWSKSIRWFSLYLLYLCLIFLGLLHSFINLKLVTFFKISYYFRYFLIGKRSYALWHIYFYFARQRSKLSGVFTFLTWVLFSLSHQVLVFDLFEFKSSKKSTVVPYMGFVLFLRAIFILVLFSVFLRSLT